MKTRNALMVLSVLAARGSFASTEDGSCLEPWKLVNFQPASPTFQQLVESKSYAERTTVILLLSAG